MSRYPTGAVSTSTSKVVSMIGVITMHVLNLKGLNLGEDIFHLGPRRDIVLIGRCEFGCVLGGSGYAFVLINF